MASHVDTISLKISGTSGSVVESLSVQSFELVTAINAIPHIVLNALPVKKSSAGSQTKMKASSHTFSDITSLYGELIEKTIGGKEKATIEITIEHTDAGKPADSKYGPQTIKLVDWILSDVGLSSVTTYSAPELVIIFSHPSIVLDRSGFIYEAVSNIRKLDEIYAKSTGEDLVGIMDNMYAQYADGEVEFYKVATPAKEGTSSRYASIVQKFRTDLDPKNNTNKLSNNLVCKPGGYFESNLLGSAIRPAIAKEVAPYAFCGSTWERLVCNILPQVIMQAVPRYLDRQIRLEPFNPWQKCSKFISNDTIMALDVGSLDPNPIKGVAMQRSSGDIPTVVQDGNVRTYGSSEDANGFGYYFPSAVNSESHGTVLAIGDSPLLANMTSNDFAQAQVTQSGNTNNNNNLQDKGDGLAGYLKAEAYERYAKAMFITNYRKNCRASITAIPQFFDSAKKLIYPGRVITVVDSKDKNNMILKGYLVKMVVKGAMDGTGSTSYELMYSRPVNPVGLYVENGKATNPCYEPLEGEGVFD